MIDRGMHPCTGSTKSTWSPKLLDTSVLSTSMDFLFLPHPVSMNTHFSTADHLQETSYFDQ